MPRLDRIDEETHHIAGSNFTFKGARLTKLTATQYTLVHLAVDETGSLAGYENDIRKMVVAAIDACRKSPMSDNLLIRVIKFSSAIQDHGIEEIHGFRLLKDIDTAQYPQFLPRGSTPLFDAAFSSIGATIEYGLKLKEQDFPTNGIVFIITDGEDNVSTMTPSTIKDKVEKANHEETMESLITILIGLNTKSCQPALDRFKREAGLTEYIDAGDVTPQKLAKISGFVSKSVSSQSQALGTGGPSQQIQATI